MPHPWLQRNGRDRSILIEEDESWLAEDQSDCDLLVCALPWRNGVLAFLWVFVFCRHSSLYVGFEMRVLRLPLSSLTTFLLQFLQSHPVHPTFPKTILASIRPFSCAAQLCSPTWVGILSLCCQIVRSSLLKNSLIILSGLSQGSVFVDQIWRYLLFFFLGISIRNWLVVFINAILCPPSHSDHFCFAIYDLFIGCLLSRMYSHLLLNFCIPPMWSYDSSKQYSNGYSSSVVSVRNIR